MEICKHYFFNSYSQIWTQLQAPFFPENKTVKEQMYWPTYYSCSAVSKYAYGWMDRTFCRNVFL